MGERVSNSPSIRKPSFCFFLGFFLTLSRTVMSAVSDLTSAASLAKQITTLVMISAILLHIFSGA